MMITPLLCNYIPCHALANLCLKSVYYIDMLGHLFVYLFVNFFSKEASMEQFSPSQWDLVASGTIREVNITYLLNISLRINSYNQF